MKHKSHQLQIVQESIRSSPKSNKYCLVLGFILAFFWLVSYPLVYITDFAGETQPFLFWSSDRARLEQPMAEINASISGFSAGDHYTSFTFLPPKIRFIRWLTDFRYERIEQSVSSGRSKDHGIPKYTEDLIKSALAYPEQKPARESSNNSISQRIFPLGSSADHRNLLNLIYKGAIRSYFPGFLATGISIILGTFLGVSASFPQKEFIKAPTNFIIKILMSLPRILFLLVVATVSGYNIYLIMISLGVLNSPRLARLMADQIKILQQQQFVESAKELGLSNRILLFKHILYYHCIYLFVIQAAFCMADSVFTETMLSYLKFAPDGVSWGQLVFDGFEHYGRGCHWMWVFPIFAIVISIGGFYILGNSALNLHHLRRQN